MCAAFPTANTPDLFHCFRHPSRDTHDASCIAERDGGNESAMLLAVGAAPPAEKALLGA